MVAAEAAKPYWKNHWGHIFSSIPWAKNSLVPTNVEVALGTEYWLWWLEKLLYSLVPKAKAQPVAHHIMPPRRTSNVFLVRMLTALLDLKIGLWISEHPHSEIAVELPDTSNLKECKSTLHEEDKNAHYHEEQGINIFWESIIWGMVIGSHGCCLNKHLTLTNFNIVHDIIMTSLIRSIFLFKNEFCKEASFWLLQSEQSASCWRR